MTKQPQLTHYNGVQIPQMRRFFQDFKPGKPQLYAMTVDEQLPHLKLTDKTLPTETCDQFLRNNMWHPVQNKWLPTYRLAPFDDRVFIGAVSEISVIKRTK